MVVFYSRSTSEYFDGRKEYFDSFLSPCVPNFNQDHELKPFKVSGILFFKGRDKKKKEKERKQEAIKKAIARAIINSSCRKHTMVNIIAR
jgi:hypothetical protein